MGRLSRSESCPEDEINFVGDWSDTEVARRWWRLCPGRLDEDKSPATCIWRGRAGYVSALIRGFFFSVVSSVTNESAVYGVPVTFASHLRMNQGTYVPRSPYQSRVENGAVTDCGFRPQQRTIIPVR